MSDKLFKFSLSIGIPKDIVQEWFMPIYESGRGAAFVDTGFLRGVIDESDEHHDQSLEHFNSSLNTNLYTTSLVFAEVVRQISKHKRPRNKFHSDKMFHSCEQILVEDKSIKICHPPFAMIEESFRTLSLERQVIQKLDLCDVTSLLVLEYAQHNRVFGFDRHFEHFGARLEP